MEIPKTADAVVIGAGVQGTSLAYNLAKLGVRNVVLLERRFVASGATGKSSALVRSHYSHPTHLKWVRRFLDFFEHAKEIIGSDCGFVQNGLLWLVAEEYKHQLIQNTRLQNEAGIKSRVVDRQEIRELFPEMKADDLSIGCYDPESGYADPAGTAMAFADAAKRLGVQIYQFTPVVRILRSGDRVSGVETTKGTIQTPVVALAAGAGARELAATVGLDFPIRHIRHEIGVFHNPPGFPARYPTVGDFRNGIYFRPEGQGLTIVGHGDTLYGQIIADQDSYNEQADYPTLELFAERLVARIPAFEKATLKGGYAGLYHVTPDGQPILGAVKEVPGLYTTVGWCHGFKMGPVVPEDIAQCIVAGPASTPHLEEFRWSRFKEGKLIRVPYPYDNLDVQLI